LEEMNSSNFHNFCPNDAVLQNLIKRGRPRRPPSQCTK
jgi:hypothetical protein